MCCFWVSKLIIFKFLVLFCVFYNKCMLLL